MYRILFIHSSIYGHLGCFCLLAIVSNADSIILRLFVFGSGTGFLGLSEHVATLLLLGCKCSVPAVSRILVQNLRGRLYLSGMYIMAQGHMVSIWLVESILGSGECAQKGKGHCLGLGSLPLNKN